MITIPDLVNAVSGSTAAYLALLRKNGNGRQEHQAWNVRESVRKLVLIDNETWPMIACTIDTNQKLITDSGAYFVSSEQPGTEILAQILSYDPKTGHAELAVKTLPAGESGRLIIDFTWLIERCLRWLETNGPRISNPFLLPLQPTETLQSDAVGSSLSHEQTTAISSLLQHPVAYVGGRREQGRPDMF